MKYKERYFMAAVLIFVVALAVGISIGFQFYEGKTLPVENAAHDFSNTDTSRIFIPGVDDDGKGVTAILETNIREGSGFVLVNINDLDAGSSTQQSARIAAKASKNYLKLNGSEIDVIYNIKTNAGTIDGPSAGAAMAVSLISLIENRTLNEKTSITGFVDETGKIGPASGIEEKATALKKEGIETLLLSNRVALPKDHIRKESCTSSQDREYCEINYVSEGEIEISGIDVIQINDLEDALEHFYTE